MIVDTIMDISMNTISKHVDAIKLHYKSSQNVGIDTPNRKDIFAQPCAAHVKFQSKVGEVVPTSPPLMYNPTAGGTMGGTWGARREQPPQD